MLCYHYITFPFFWSTLTRIELVTRRQCTSSYDPHKSLASALMHFRKMTHNLSHCTPCVRESLVDRGRIELPTEACKATVFPVIPTAQICESSDSAHRHLQPLSNHASKQDYHLPWRLVGVSIPLPLQWQCSALPIELTKHEYVALRTLAVTLSWWPKRPSVEDPNFNTLNPLVENVSLPLDSEIGGDDWSRTSSARGGGFTVHWGYQFSYISKNNRMLIFQLQVELVILLDAS